MDLGINLLIAEHGGTPGSNIGSSYEFPSFEQIDYYAAKGFTHIRLPLPWERLQSSLNGDLDPTYVAKIQELVRYADSLGLDVVLDVHNYGAYNGELIGSDAVPVSAFADLWGKVGSAFASEDNVRFGLMNETQVTSVEEWLDISNAAIAAIREAGADQQILVSGIDWQAASRFTTNGNSDAFADQGAIVDPASNFAIELHQYLDDTSGQNAWVVSETIGVERLMAVTEWARENGYKLYLGEFAVADNETALKALDNMLAFMEANSDVWEAAAYWGGGAGWTDYMFSPNPDLGILDVGQMGVLDDYTAATYTQIKQPDGTIRVETHLPNRAGPSIVDIVSADGSLMSRTIYSVDGEATHSVTRSAEGGYIVTRYSNLPDGVAASIVAYDAEQLRITETTISTDGSVEVAHFDPGAHDASVKESYNPDGSLRQIVTFDDGGITFSIYENGHLAKVERYTDGWQFVSRATYDADGTLVTLHTLNADGSNTVSQFNGTTGIIVSSVDYTKDWVTIDTSSYDKAGNLISTVALNTDGTKTIDKYEAGCTDFLTKEVFDASGRLLSCLTNKGTDGFTNVTYSSSGLVATTEVYGANWALQSRTTYDAKGHVTSIYEVAGDGTNIVQNFAPSNQAHPSSIDTFTASWQLVSRTHLAADGSVQSIDWVNSDGSHRIETMNGGGKVAAVELYSATWTLLTRTEYDSTGNVTSIREHTSSGHTVTYFTADNQKSPTIIDQFTTDWKIESRTHLDTFGNVASIDYVNPDGTHRVEYFAPGVQFVVAEDFFSADWKLLSHNEITVSQPMVGEALLVDEPALDFAAAAMGFAPVENSAPALLADASIWDSGDASPRDYVPLPEHHDYLVFHTSTGGNDLLV